MPNGPDDIAAGAINPESYTINGTDTASDTVVDNVTNLMWERGNSPGEESWQTAPGYCATLALAGYHDWRLPSVIEMISIMEFGPSGQDTTTFLQTGTFWTSTHFDGPPSGAWYVSFDFGLALGIVSIGDGGEVRCVRSLTCMTPQTNRYAISDAGTANATVYDSNTKLAWQQAGSADMYTWSDAKTYCANTMLGGTGWRLPTVRELETIVDFSRTSPSVDPSFQAMPAGYWSNSTKVSSNATWAWVVSFVMGTVASHQVTEMTYVRCVR